MLNGLIAFSYFRFGNKPCVYFYSVSNATEVLKVDSALALMHFTTDKATDSDPAKSYIIFQVNCVLGKAPIAGRDELSELVVHLSSMSDKLCGCGLP